MGGGGGVEKGSRKDWRYRQNTVNIRSPFEEQSRFTHIHNNFNKTSSNSNP